MRAKHSLGAEVGNVVGSMVLIEGRGEPEFHREQIEDHTRFGKKYSLGELMVVPSAFLLASLSTAWAVVSALLLAYLWASLLTA